MSCLSDWVSVLSGPGDQGLSVLLTETRQQNSELRVAVGRVADKVDSVSEKVRHGRRLRQLSPWPVLHTQARMRTH